MKNESIKKNFIYNVVYQILILFIPLITIPYVSRVIGAEGVGQYSYTYSVVYYFMIFSMLGFNNYGNRSIAKVRDNKEKLSKTYKEIHSLQLITTAIMSIAYIVYLLVFCTNYKLISIIQFLYVLSCFFDINWFFFGIEKFKITVTRNALVKVLSLILIFIFVRTKNDIAIYVLILAGSTFFSQLLLMPFLKKYIVNAKVSFIDIRKHFIPCLKLFLPVIAIYIYKIMDKTMLGLMTDISEVGFYENAEKIVNVPISIIGALGTVMLPRMTNMFANGNDSESKKIIEKSMEFVMFISLPMMIGLICISSPFTNIFLGPEFNKSSQLISILSITILFLSWGNVIRSQYLIPKEMDKDYIISAFLGAIVNFIMNMILIPKYNSIGACYGTIAAELVVVLYQTIKVWKYLPITQYIKKTIPFIFSSIIMCILIIPINKINITDFSKVILEVSLGAFIYIALNSKYIIRMVFKKGKTI